MNRDAPDTRNRNKGWSFPERTFQWTASFALIAIIACITIALAEAQLWTRGLFHR